MRGAMLAMIPDEDVEDFLDSILKYKLLPLGICDFFTADLGGYTRWEVVHEAWIKKLPVKVQNDTFRAKYRKFWISSIKSI